jgi:DnaK suppressor protein
MSLQKSIEHLNATLHLDLSIADLTDAYPMSIQPARDGMYLVATSENAEQWHEALYRNGQWHGSVPVPAGGVWRGLNAPAHIVDEEPIEDWARRTLSEMRKRTLQGLIDLKDVASQTAGQSPDTIDQAADRMERDTTLLAIDTLQNRLREIDAALRRIDAGEYGICPDTGEEIPRERLRANPLALHTVEHQQRLDVMARLRGHAA